MISVCSLRLEAGVPKTAVWSLPHWVDAWSGTPSQLGLQLSVIQEFQELFKSRCIHHQLGVYTITTASQVALLVKNWPANTGDKRDDSSIPGSGRSPGGEHDNPLQYSCLENPMDRGSRWAVVHGIAKSWTWMKQLSMHAHTLLSIASMSFVLLSAYWNRIK